MKTTIFKAIVLGALVWLSFAPTQVKAQVVNPYMVTNDLLCTVTIRWTIYTINPMTGACDVVCDFGTIAIPPGPPPTFIPWNPACAGCRVRVAIIDIGGTAIVPPLVGNFPFPPPPTVMGPAPAGCSPTGNVVMDVLPNAAHIHP